MVALLVATIMRGHFDKSASCPGGLTGSVRMGDRFSPGSLVTGTGSEIT